LRGDCRVLGEAVPLFDDPATDRRLKVGLVFGGGRLLHSLTLGENVTLPMRYHQDLDEDAAMERVAAILEATALTPLIGRMPGTLARHWHQRAGLARALAVGPEVLLLDDPLFGLDSLHIHWWVRFLDDLRHGRHRFCPGGVTLVLTCDNFAPWWALATHAAVLEGGRFSTLGCLDAPEVRQHPKAQDYGARGRWAFDPDGRI